MQDLTSLRATVARLRLLGMERALALPTETLAAAYNGTGPEFLPRRIRQRLDALTRPFWPAVMVHDLEFTFSDGTRRSFLIANQHLLWNCIICANNAYQWNNWRRYALYIQAYSMFRAVSHPKFGWTAWVQAYNKTQNRKEK